MDLFAKVNFSALEKSLSRHVRNPLILDTGPLLFLLIGLFDPAKKNARDIWQGHTQEELSLLKKIVKPFRKIIITPQILAECTNLINQKVDKSKKEFLLYRFVEPLKSFGEVYVEKDVILAYNEFPRLGSTDIGIVECSKRSNSLIITEDSDLKRYCKANQVPCLNFNELRPSTWK